jgi:CDP-4-dehydro-6-deoxyglucose reductase
VFNVTLKSSGRQFLVAPGETVLEAAQRAGVALPYSCRAGVCGSCKAILLDGRCEYPRNPPLALNAGELAHHAVLLCQAVPASDLLLEAREVTSVEDIARRQLAMVVTEKWRLAEDVVGLRLLPAPGERWRTTSAVRSRLPTVRRRTA